MISGSEEDDSMMYSVDVNRNEEDCHVHIPVAF